MIGVISLIAVATTLILLALVWRQQHRQLRAKGYGWPTILFTFAFLLLLCIFVYAGVMGEGATNDARAVLVFIVPPLAWMLLVAGLTRVLPARGAARAAGPRVAGRRSSWVPYRFFGRSAYAVALAFVVFMLWQLFDPSIVPRKDSWRLLVAVLAAAGAGEYFMGLARRLHDAPLVLPKTTGSVLYLRAFGEEHRHFVSGPTSILRKYTDQFAAKMPGFKSRSDPAIKL